jgi:hypothetical protein
VSGKWLAVELHGVDPDVDQHFNTAVAQQTDGMFGGKQRCHFPGKRGNHFIIRRNNRRTATQQTAGKGRVRHLIQGQYRTGHR